MTQASERLYVYGIARSEALQAGAPVAAPAVAEPEDEPVWRVCGDLAALASQIAADRIRPLRRHLLAHAKVLEAAMADRTILPMSFGLISAPDALDAVLAREAQTFLTHLGRLDGKAEYGVTATWRRARAFDELLEARPDLAAERDRLAARDPAESHYQRVELGRRIEAGLSEKRRTERGRLALALRSRWPEAVLHEPADEMTVLKADFLIACADAEAFDGDVRALAEAEEGRLDFKLIGPAPPYNFVDLKVAFAPAERRAA